MLARFAGAHQVLAVVPALEDLRGLVGERLQVDLQDGLPRRGRSLQLDRRDGHVDQLMMPGRAAPWSA